MSIVESLVVPNISVSEMNEASAKVNRKYFTSSVCSPDMIRLSNFIDTEADILTAAEMEEIFTEVLCEFLSGQRIERVLDVGVGSIPSENLAGLFL
jgi:protein-L-isoaspartate O-methyltransferase